MGLKGGNCLSLASSVLISVSFRRNASLSSASMCRYALSASLFCVARNRPYKVLAISMGVFLSATSPALSAFVHGAGMLTSSSSSSPPSANLLV